MTVLLGVNAPYFRGNYGHDLAPSARFPEWPVSFDPMTIYRALVEAKDLGLGAVRIWLCENAEGLLVDGERIVGVHPDLLTAVDVIQEGAARVGLRVYFTLLDANAATRENDPFTRSILAEPDQRNRFAEMVAAPIAKRLDSNVLLGIDVVNEPEVTTRDCERVGTGEPIAWESIGATIRTVRSAILAEHGDALVTSGTTHVFLPQLWRSGAELTAVDIHVYHPQGGLPSRDDLARYVGDSALLTIPLIAGECGIPKATDADEVALVNFIYNGESCDYSAVFLWQLDGVLVHHKAAGRPFTEIGNAVGAHSPI